MTKTCPHCGAKMQKYKHTLNKQMATALKKLAAIGGRAKLKELGLTYTEESNFQKLRYFDLVAYGYHEDGSRDGGVWVVTDRGYRFLSGKIWIPKRVETYRGERTHYIKDERCTMRSLQVEPWRKREDYSNDSEPFLGTEVDV